MKDRLHLYLRVLVSLIFFGAGLGKVLAPGTFALSVDRYQILPWPWVIAVSSYLPWLEIVCALALCIDATRRSAALILFALSSLFVSVLLTARIRGLDIECGCFGTERHDSLDTALARALILAIIISILLRHEFHILHERAAPVKGLKVS